MQAAALWESGTICGSLTVSGHCHARFVQFARTIGSRLNIRENVFSTHMVKESALGEEPGGLLHRSTQQQCAPGAPQTLRKTLHRVDTAGVNRPHVAQAECP